MCGWLVRGQRIGKKIPAEGYAQFCPMSLTYESEVDTAYEIFKTRKITVGHPAWFSILHEA